MIAMNAHSLGVIILLLIALRCHLGDWTQAALKSWLGGGRRLAIQPDLHLSRFAHLRLIKPDALTAAAGALADSVVPKFEVMEVRGPGRMPPGPYQASTELIQRKGHPPVLTSQIFAAVGSAWFGSYAAAFLKVRDNFPR